MIRNTKGCGNWLNWAKRSTVQHKTVTQLLNVSTMRTSKTKTRAQVTSLHVTSQHSSNVSQRLPASLLRVWKHDASSAEILSEADADWSCMKVDPPRDSSSCLFSIVCNMGRLAHWGFWLHSGLANEFICPPLFVAFIYLFLAITWAMFTLQDQLAQICKCKNQIFPNLNLEIALYTWAWYCYKDAQIRVHCTFTGSSLSRSHRFFITDVWVMAAKTINALHLAFSSWRATAELHKTSSRRWKLSLLIFCCGDGLSRKYMPYGSCTWQFDYEYINVQSDNSYDLLTNTNVNNKDQIRAEYQNRVMNLVK